MIKSWKMNNYYMKFSAVQISNIAEICEILGFRSGVVADCFPLSYDAVSLGNPITTC
jgi:uncharacterized metal-binding protein